MALTDPYTPDTVTDGVDDVEAAQHNRQENQLEPLTEYAVRLNRSIIVAAPDMGGWVAGSPATFLTTRALDTGKSIKVKIGASNYRNLTGTNAPGPAGTDESTNLQTFTLPTLLEMGCSTGSGDVSAVKLVVYEDLARVGWIDVFITAP